MNLFLCGVINQLGMLGGLSSFSSKQCWQKTASCADAALGLEMLLGKTVTLGRDHICEEMLLTHSIDICWDVLVLNNCISETVKNHRKGWEAERLSCS